MSTVADVTEPEWFKRIHAATTSWTRFRVLDLAHEGRVTPTAIARTLKCDPKAATQHLSGLAEHGLVEPTSGGAFEVTGEGRDVHAHLLAAGEAPAKLFRGRRLLAVRYDERSDRKRLRRQLEREAEIVLRADGDVDLVAFFRDQPDLVADLERSAKAVAMMTLRARIAD